MRTTPQAPLTHAPVSHDTLADPSATVDAWGRWLERTGLADETKRAYLKEGRGFAVWLAGQDQHAPGEVFTDPHTRDYAVRDYRRHLATVRKRAPMGVRGAMTGITNLYGWLGMDAPDVPITASRTGLAPKALSEDQARAVLRAAERRGPRDLALVTVALGTGLRVSELAALDTDDYWSTDRKGEVHVRKGKGDKPRSVPLNQQTREALRVWAADRSSWAGREDPALFLSTRGVRLAVRSVRHAITGAGKDAGLVVAPHLLRHTFATRMVRQGVDLVTVGTLLGHGDLNTTRIYTAPNGDDLEAAVTAATVDY